METGRATDAPFVVALGDSIIGLERQSDIVRRMADAFDETRAAAVIALEQIRREDAASYGIVLPPDGGSGSLIELADLVEKPRPAAAPNCG